MIRVNTINGKRNCFFLLMIMLILCIAACAADEIRYGFTLTRIRVREAPSVNAAILDHIEADRCVLIQAEATEGNTRFIGVTYRDATGDLSTGWIARSDGGKVYVDDLSNETYMSEFGLEPGTLPSDEAGTSGGHYTVDFARTAASVSAPTAAPAPTQREETARTDTPSGESSSDGAGLAAGSAEKELVRYCQQALKDIGIYYGEITGNIGTKTKNSIMVFQRRNGLPATGELDELTVLRIRAAVEPEEQTEAPVPESTPEPVMPAEPVQESKTSAQTTDSGNENLTIDSTGETVYLIQEKLQALGYYTGSLTGHFGAKTAAAVKQFQKSNGLTVTGVADAQTVSAILYGTKSRESSTTETSSDTTETQTESGAVYRKGDQADIIAEMQTLLSDLRLYSGDITGHFGSKTKDAVQTFQRKYRLTVSGDLDAETIAAIRNAAADMEEAAESNSNSSSSYEYIDETEDRSGGTGIYTLDWFTAKNNGVFPYLGLVRGNYATLKDLNTGKALRVYIQSAGYHLDVEPATATDTATLCSIYGVSSASSIPYNRRPALITTSEGYRIVCSIYGTPHGQQVITNNNYNGQFCLHFLNSKTSGSNKVDSGHQSSIQSAISMTGGSAKTIQTVSDIR